MNRWVIYQRERFPLAAHAPLVAAFSASAVCFSSLLRGHAVAPSPAALVVAFTTSLLFFLQLRIADEFKDCEDDTRFRPYRPVPRGLVTLPELGALGVAAAVVQLGLALWLHAPLVWLLVPSWLYLVLMTREFFARRWLKAHPMVYLASHMLVLPLIDLYATACDWLVAGERTAHVGLLWFLVVSYLNGIVIEIGRKTRVAADEEHGVETYSALWGKHGAARAWLLAVLLTGCGRLGSLIANRIGGADDFHAGRAHGGVHRGRASFHKEREPRRRQGDRSHGRSLDAPDVSRTRCRSNGPDVVAGRAMIAAKKAPMTMWILGPVEALDSPHAGGKARALARAVQGGACVFRTGSCCPIPPVWRM